MSRLWTGVSAAAVVAAMLALGLDAAAQDKKAPAAKTASPCKGLDEKACKAKTAECRWVVPKKGKQRPYCRLK
jgi:hypothetical protein